MQIMKQLKRILLSLLMLTTVFLSTTKAENDNIQLNEFIEKIGPTAQTLAYENDLYASVMIAQAFLESRQGQSKLSLEPDYNLFGIKGTYKGKGNEYKTKEYTEDGEIEIIATFRSYPSYLESMEDYVKLLKKDLYKKTWKTNTDDYKDATKALTGLYATDMNYGTKLNNLIEKYDLTRFDEAPYITIKQTEIEDIGSGCTVSQ